MKAVIQRVSNASVSVDGHILGAIRQGLLVLLGVEQADTSDDVIWLGNKIAQIRIFNDEQGLMNKSIKEVDGDILLISQFTLHASTKKGNRPSFIQAARPEHAKPLYESMKQHLEKELKKNIHTGLFGAEMRVSLVNDGPVTIVIDSKIRI